MYSGGHRRFLGAMDGMRNAMTNDFTIAFAYVHER